MSRTGVKGVGKQPPIRECQINVRLTKAELRRFARAARHYGRTVSEHAREVMRLSAERVEREKRTEQTVAADDATWD